MRDFWHNKRVLVTGHTGFKGGWLTIWLKEMGSTVCGLSLEPVTKPSLFELAHVAQGVEHHICDIRKRDQTQKLIEQFDPEIVLHLAAQPLVRDSYDDPAETLDTNVMGTVNVLESLRVCDAVQSVVVVTTDKVYENLESSHAYVETDQLGGHDPYSASKAASEIVCASYRKSFFADKEIGLASARAGNVIGGGDWSKDRLIPDAVSAWQVGRTLEIRSPDSVRPWQHVLEPVFGYLVLAQKLYENRKFAQSYNFGPRLEDAQSVKTVIELARRSFDHGAVNYGTNLGPHEAGRLMLNVEKAASELGVRPRWDLEVAVAKTMEWYRHVSDGVDPRTLCIKQIEEFVG